MRGSASCGLRWTAEQGRGASIRNWLSKRREYSRSGGKGPQVPDTESGLASTDGVFTKCESCGEPIYEKDLANRFNVCPHCEFHYPLSAPDRVRLLADSGSFDTRDEGMLAGDPMGFEGYGEKLAAAREKTGLDDAVLSGTGRIGGHPVAIAAMDFRFIGGSMGSVVGEKISRTMELAYDEGLPLVVVSSFGGVTASFATAADVVIAEPKARIGFAGARVIESTTKERLPEGFQTAEFQKEHGLVDRIVHRLALKNDLERFLGLLS